MSNEIRTAMMVDIETLSNTRDAAILTIGAVSFSPFNLDVEPLGLYLKIDPKDAIKHGTVSESTIEWWEKQPKEIYKEAFNGKASTEEALRELHYFFTPNIKYIFAKGTDFDIPIIEAKWEKFNLSPPYKWWNKMDYRTLTKICDPKLEKNSHNALEDALNQVYGVQNIFQQLGIKGFVKSFS